MESTTKDNGQLENLNEEILKANYALIYDEYKRQNERLKNMDTKASMLLVFIGVLLTIFANVIKIESENLNIIIISWIVCFAYIVVILMSISMVVLSFRPRAIDSLGTSNYVAWENYKCKIEEHYKEMIETYKDILDNAKEVINNKANYIRMATYFACASVVLLIVLLVINLI